MEKLSPCEKEMKDFVDFKYISKIWRNFIVCVVYSLVRHIQDIIIHCFAVIHTLAELTDFMSSLNIKK
jgi:hypothetical protein